MFGWLFGPRQETTAEAYREALSCLRGVCASQVEQIKALSEQVGALKATVDMQFNDLRALKTAGISPPPAAARPASPLLAVLDSDGKPKEAPPQPTFRSPFHSMAVSGGHVAPPRRAPAQKPKGDAA